jgi:hypothetical protein
MLSLVLQMTKRRKVLTGLFLYKLPISEILKISCTRSRCQDKSKVRLRTGHEGTEGEQGSTLSLTSSLEGGAWLRRHPGRFTPRQRPVTHFTGGWVGLRASLDGCGISRPHWDLTVETVDSRYID